MKKFLLLLFLSVITAQGQGDFRAYASTEQMLEGGKVDKLTVVYGNIQFNMRPPKNWFRQVDEANHKITFTSPSSKSAIVIRFTTKSPGELPPEDELRAQVLLEHPGAAILGRSICPTSLKPGVCFDLVSLPTPQLVQKIRHAFVAHPGGQAEFVLTASDDEFDKCRQTLMNTLRAFRADVIKSKSQ